MAAIRSEIGRDVGDEPGSRTSSVPLLGEGFSETGHQTRDSLTAGNIEQDGAGNMEEDSKSGKRRFWGLGKKIGDDKLKKKREAVSTSSVSKTLPPTAAISPNSSIQSPGTTFASSPPQHASLPYGVPSSPRHVSSPSPRLSSPASSQIFERNVQEDGLYTSASPAIPAHITTENHIPPVLDASSVAITDDHLNPDNVEIVMHSAHQPAAVTVTGAGSSEAAGTSWPDDLVAHPDNDDAASNYGALDSNDVRRLSFISFADVVHAEHAEHAEHSNNRDSVHLSGIPNMAPLPPGNRSPSPVRAPTNPYGMGGSPSMSASPSFRGLETSPNRGGRAPGSPRAVGHSPPTGGELTIETMRQALRKTGSGDLSGARSQPISAAGGDDGTAEQIFK
ncbi:hypothetical protein MMC24_001850 [Lignoscripta atroalba]|nr:hypothetical protein [Lignoscripta atroalba]